MFTLKIQTCASFYFIDWILFALLLQSLVILNVFGIPLSQENVNNKINMNLINSQEEKLKQQSLTILTTTELVQILYDEGLLYKN